VTALKPYPQYKPSGVEWLGDIPAGWVKNKIKNVTDFQVGWTPSTSEDKYFIGNNSWANISDLKGKTIFETEKCLSDEAVQNNRIKINPKGSLLFSFKLSVGAVSFAGIDLYTNEAVASFLTSSKINLAFLYYAAPLFILQNASNNIYGAKILNQELIRNAIIVPPTPTEQTRIAEFLDMECGKIDALIGKSEKIVALLDEKRQAVITHYVTKGTNPTAPLKPSGIDWLGDIPAGWSVKKLKYLVTEKNDKTDTPVGKVVLLENIESWTGIVRNSEQENDLLGELKIFEPNDVLFNKLRPYLAKIYRAKEAGCCSGEILVLRPRSRILADFLFFRLASEGFISLVNSSTYGVKMPRASWEDFISKIFISFPSIEEQKKIAEKIQSQTAKIDALKEKIIKQIELLKERKTSLITAAVTGKIDVRAYKKQQEAA
jgi:type I restriction enzyme S subunit